MYKRFLSIIIIILLVAFLGYRFRSEFYRNTRQNPGESKIQVAASFYPLYYFASQIGGEKAKLINITPAGAEPHDYEPTAQDAAQIENSRLLILNGGGLEAWGENIKQNINSAQTVIVTAGEGLVTQHIIEDRKNIVDPHFWLSPQLARQMVDKITAGFSAADPKNSSYYQTNADVLKKKLADLDMEYTRGLSACANQNIITSHAAFGYLASAYHLNQVSIAGLSPDAEPSPQQLAQIVDFAKQHDVKYIFFESLASPKLSDTLANEVGAKTLVLNPIEGLSDSELAQGKNYFTEMKNNLINLQTALQCTR